MLHLGLPQELLLQIVEHLDRDALKNVRLTSKSVGHFAASKLFQTVHLTPNMRSFDRARAIASSPHLSNYVKAVVFHVGILEDFYDGFDAFKKYIVELHRPSGSIDELMEDILWKYHCFLEEMDGQRDFEISDELEELESICQEFSMLESITTTLDEYSPFVPPLDFIGQRTGCQSVCSANGPHFSNLFHAASGKSLTSVSGGSMSWYSLDGIVQDYLEEVDLRSIRSLSLGLFNSEFLTMEIEVQETALSSLEVFFGAFAASGGLRVLQLDFDEITLDDDREELSDISTVVLATHWPSLHTLSLQGIVATENELVGFLVSHAETLRRLHLDGIDLLHEITYDVKGNSGLIQGSILNLFYQINTRLFLDSARISGNFANHHGEGWCANPAMPGSDCLRRRIELWLSHKGPSPFPDEVLRCDTATPYRDNGSWSFSDGAISGEAHFGPAKGYTDDSWQWDEDLAV